MIKLEVKSISIGKNQPSIELSKRITKRMYNHVMTTFEQEGPGWEPLRSRTKKQRLAQGFGEGPILNRKRGTGRSLIGKIIESSSETKATVGVAGQVPYAAIHQFGGTFNRISQPGRVQLRTTRSGKLERQKKYPNLAVFRKKSVHKMFKEVEYKGGKSYSIRIPARPYLKFTQELLSDIKKIAVDFFSGR